VYVSGARSGLGIAEQAHPLAIVHFVEQGMQVSPHAQS
jgi:hypothetical protein